MPSSKCPTKREKKNMRKINMRSSPRIESNTPMGCSTDNRPVAWLVVATALVAACARDSPPVTEVGRVHGEY